MLFYSTPLMRDSRVFLRTACCAYEALVQNSNLWVRAFVSVRCAWRLLMTDLEQQ